MAKFDLSIQRKILVQITIIDFSSFNDTGRWVEDNFYDIEWYLKGIFLTFYFFRFFLEISFAFKNIVLKFGCSLSKHITYLLIYLLFIDTISSKYGPLKSHDWLGGSKEIFYRRKNLTFLNYSEFWRRSTVRPKKNYKLFKPQIKH